MRAIRRSEQTGSNSVGSFVDSSLTEPQFQELNGINWVLCDGRDVTGSRWHTITGQTNIPNHAGLVRRMPGSQSVNGRTKTGPTLGAVQEDQLQDHQTNSTGNHSHPQRISQGGGGSTVASQGVANVSAGHDQSATPTSDAGNHSHVLAAASAGTPRTGQETRVSALGANVFIKIN